MNAELSTRAAPGDPFERVLAALRQRRANLRYVSTDSVRATCPAHSDGRPSLVVTHRGGKVLMRCFAGCRIGTIVQALELRMADLFSGARTARARGEIVATYDYHDRDDVLVAQKVRYLPKRFAWRRPDASARGGWRWGLNGPVPGLYRWPELIDEPVVFLTETRGISRRRGIHCRGIRSPGAARVGEHLMTGAGCAHIAAISTVKHAKRRECEECVKIGSGWVHLRTCQECGQTRCCDDSPNRHASKHAQASDHPMIASAEPGERWLYYYPDDAFAEY